MYVSPDGRGDSLPINPDAFIHAGLFAPGDRDTPAVASGRGGLQVVHGRLTVLDMTLAAGDGLGIAGADEALEMGAATDSEVLRFDVRMDAPMLWG